MNPTGFFVDVGGVKTDLKDVFEPLTTTKTSDTGFKSVNNANKDLAELFEPYPGTGTKAETTKYVVYSTGLDLCDIFTKKVPTYPTLSTSPSTAANTQYSAMYQSVVLTANRSSGVVRRSTDYGKTFFEVTNANFSGLNWRCIKIDQNQAIAVSTVSVFTSNDYGDTWTLRTPTSTNFSGAAIYNGLMIAADQANNKLYFSADNGVSWLSQTISFPRGCAVTMNGSSYVVVVCNMNSANGAVGSGFQICNNFNPAVTTNTFVSCTFKGVSPIDVALDGQYGVCVSYTGTLPGIKYSIDYGQRWLLADVIPTTGFTMASLSGGFAIATVGASNSYYISNDYGQTWTTLTGPQSYVDCGVNYSNWFTLCTMSATPSSFYYYGAVSSLRPSLASVTGFDVSSSALTTTSTNIQHCWIYQNIVMAIGSSGGAIRRSTDYGATFSTVTITGYTSETWKYVVIDQTQGIAISSGRIFTSNDSGATWTVRSPTSTNFTGGAYYNGLMMVADQANSKLYYSTDNGVNWRNQIITYPRGCAIAQNGSTYVVLVTGMTTSTSAIASFCSICTNFNPAVTTNTFVNTTYTGAIPFLVALDGKYAVCSCLGGSTNKSIKYSSDYGQNWTNISENITTDCYVVSISNGYAIVSPSTTSNYYISNNYGQTWQTLVGSPSITTVGNFSNRGVLFTRSGTNTFAYNGTLI